MSIKGVGKKSPVFGPSPMVVSSTSLSKRNAKSVVGRASTSLIRSENITPGNGFNGRNPEAHKQIPAKMFLSTDGKLDAVSPFNRVSKPQGAKSSTGLRPKLASKASHVLCHGASQNGQSYLRSSTGSCHDACKFGTHWPFEGSNASESGGNSSSSNNNSSNKKAISKAGVSGTKFSSKVSATKISKISTAVKSPVRSRNSEALKSALRTPEAKITVNSRIRSDAKLVKSNSRPSPEGKSKVARSLFRSPRRGPEGPDHHREKMNLPMQKDNAGIKCQTSMPGRPVASSASPNGVLINTAFGVEGRELLDINCQICDDQSEDEFFRDYSACAGEPYYAFIQTPPGYRDHGSSNKVNTEYHEFGDREISQFANHPELDYPFDNNGEECSSEYSEPLRSGASAEGDNYNIAEKGQHRRYMISEEKNAGASVPHKRKFRGIRHGSGGIMNPEPDNVILRHQDMQGRKPSEEWMIDHVIGEAVNKLSHYEESKVKVLVGAFETVISLTDQSETSELKQTDPRVAKDLPPIRTLQACN